MITLVVPCFNEANRFNISNWQLLVDSFPDYQWVFVNDGSGDATAQTLQLLIGKNVKVLNLPKNLGKGEAIRAGMISALDSNQAGQPEQIGYLDADGAFNISDISKMLDLANNYLGPMTSYCALISSRVKLAGRSISRSSLRHYLGRIIATFICAGWNNAPYDTQSGFKLFRVDSLFCNIIAKKFRTRWFFDIEILLELERSSQLQVWEEPLSQWREIGNSKINSRQYYLIFKEVLKIRALIKKHNTYLNRNSR